MRKSLKGNDSMVWKEWAPAGLEVPTTWSPILGDGGELVHRGLTREGQAFLSGAKTEQPHLPLGFPPPTFPWNRRWVKDPQAGTSIPFVTELRKCLNS